MKKIISVILVCIIMLTLLCGCTEQTQNDKFTVYTTIYPIYDFAVKIGGEKVTVNSIVPKGSEPHDFEPTAQDIVNLSKADILIYNGLGMENWIEDSKATLKNTKMLCVSENIELIENEGITDPHIWLDPTNAIIICEEIKNAFCENDSQNADYYTENFNSLKEKLTALDNRYKDELKDIKERNIITAHRAFGYLCNRYGLTQISVEGAVSGSEPEAKALIGIIDFAKENNIKTVFVAEEGESKVADTLAEEIGGEVKILYNLESLSDSQQACGEEYFSIMNENLNTLKEVLK